jgi:signal transduction histidine kinase
MTPRQLWRRSVAGIFGLFVISAIFILGLESTVLDLTRREAELGRIQSLLFLPVALFGVVAWTSILLRRVYPLLRAEPSLSAYRAALALPFDFLRGAVVVVTVAGAVDLVLQLRAGRVDPLLAVGMDFLAVAEATTLLLVAYVLLRRAIHPVLVLVPPARVDVPRTEKLGRKLAVAFAVLTGTFALAVGITALRALDAGPARAAAVALAHDLALLGAAPAVAGHWSVVGLAVTSSIVLAATVASAAVGARLAGRLGGDLHTATAALDDLARGSSERASSPPPAPDLLRFAEVRELGRCIADLTQRFDDLSRLQTRSIQARAEAQRMKGQFLASMSHDLRSPLNSIIGFSELLLRGIEGPLTPAQKEVLRIIHGSGEDLLRLINDILDSAKLEAGRLDVQREWTPSVEILNETIKRSREFVGDKDIDLVAELQPGLPPVFVDADRLSQAFLNIIANAFKFMEQGTVRVRASIGQGAPGPVGQYLRVEIADTGTGIREEDRDNIFEAFRQVDGSSSRRTGGMGLGLSLARAIVELHGGKVWVESRLGAGSVFTVAVPVGE